MHTWTIGPAPVAAAVTCGQILTQSTRLTNDLIDCGGYGLIVGAPGITIDLDGHIVDGMGLDAGILNNGHDDVTITNGFVHEFLYGVQLNPGTARNVVHDLRIELAGEAAIALADADQAGQGNTIRDNSLVGNELGIALYSGTRHAVIRDNSLAATTGEGAIFLEFASDNLIEGNQLSNTGGSGIHMVGGGGNTVVENTIKDSGGFAITAGEELLQSNDNVVLRNTIEGGQGGVMVGGLRNQVINNEVTGAVGPGVVLELASNTLVRGNDFGGSAAGVVVSEGSNNTIEANNASGTLGSGIEIGELSSGNVVRNNTASANGGAGIEVSESSVVGQGNVIENNTADSNGGDGIYVEGVGHVIRDNVAQLNGGWGIYSIGGTDGGGNFAAGNMEPDQCFGVVCTLGTVPGAPDTWIVEGPVDINTGLAGVQSNSRNASFTYMGVDEFSPITDIVFECRIDSTNPLAWEDCEYPAEYLNLSPGEHTFEVRAVDMLGQGLADPTPASFTWTYVPLPSGVAPPPPILDVVPPLETWLPEAIFTFHSDEPDVTFQCKVDSNGYEPCGFEGATFMSQGAYEAAGRGDRRRPAHVLRARHRLRGQRRRARDVHLDAPRHQRRVHRRARLHARERRPGRRPGDRRPDAEHLGARSTSRPTSPTRSSSAGSTASSAIRSCPARSPFVATGLLMGEHVLEVYAESETVFGGAELEAVVYEWEVVETLDTVPPETSIERAPGPADLSSTIFEFTGTDDLTPAFLLTFECQVTNGTALPNENEWVACFSPFNLLDVYTYARAAAVGVRPAHVLRARGRPRRSGVPEPAAARLRGQPRPDAGIVHLDAGARHARALRDDLRRAGERRRRRRARACRSSSSASTTRRRRSSSTSSASSSWRRWTSGRRRSTGSPASRRSPPEASNPGEYTFAVRAVDLAGNAGPAATRTFTVAAAPVVTILSGPDGRIDPTTGEPALPFSSSESAVFTFASDQPGSTFECSVDGSDFLPCGGLSEPWTHAAWVVESGTHEFVVRATNPQLILGEETVYEWLVQLGPRRHRAELDDHRGARERDAAPGSDLRLHRHRQPDSHRRPHVRVRARLADRVELLRVAAAVLRPHPRRAHAARARDRRGRQHRVDPRRLHVDGGGAAARDDPVRARRRPGGVDQQDGDLHVLERHAGRDLRVLARRPVQPAAGTGMRLRRDLREPRPRRPPVRGPRRRRVRQPRGVGGLGVPRPSVPGRPHRRPGNRDRHDGDVRVHERAARPERSVLLLARRLAVRPLRVAEDLHAPLAGRAHVPGADRVHRRRLAWVSRSSSTRCP